MKYIKGLLVLLLICMICVVEPVYGEDVSITISATGDVTLGTDKNFAVSTNFNTMYKSKNASYFLKKVKSVFDNDDMTLVNFEGTLTSRNTRADKTFAFKGPSKYINILKKGSVEAVSFANNHCRDYGKGSYTDTIKVFKKNKIPYASYTKVGIYKVKGKKIGMIAVNGLDGLSYSKSCISSGMKKLKKKKADIIIVSMHAGIERDYYPNSLQTSIAKYAIDKGANLVLGHHPHVLQGIRKYKGVYIVYSLGNFCFGGNSNPKDKDTMIFQKTFTFKNNKLKKDNNIKVIPCSVSSVTYRNNYQPMVLTGNRKKKVIKRINTYSRKYHIKFNNNGKLKK